MEGNLLLYENIHKKRKVEKLREKSDGQLRVGLLLSSAIYANKK